MGAGFVQRRFSSEPRYRFVQTVVNRNVCDPVSRLQQEPSQTLSSPIVGTRRFDDSVSSINSPKPCTIRPLTAAYNAASSSNKVILLKGDVFWCSVYCCRLSTGYKRRADATEVERCFNEGYGLYFRMILSGRCDCRSSALCADPISGRFAIMSSGHRLLSNTVRFSNAF